MTQIMMRIGVGALILNDKGQVLLGLRNVVENHGKWEFLGGLIKDQETLEDGLKRNIREEAGIEIEPDLIIGHNDKYSEDGLKRDVGFTFRCRFVSGTPHRTAEDRVADFQWLDPFDALKQDLTPITRLQLEQYQVWLAKQTAT